MKMDSTTALTPALSPRRGSLVNRHFEYRAAAYAPRSPEQLQACENSSLSPGERVRVRTSVTHFPTFILSVCIGASLLTGCATAQQTKNEYFSNWPAGTSPAEIGKRVAENFVARKFDFQGGRRQYVIYPEACAWYGSLTVAKLTGDKDLQSRLIKKFDDLQKPGDTNRISPNAHVDYRVIGIVPLEIYLQNGDKKLQEIGQGLADKQWDNPTEDGVTREARYWVDDMYMIPAVQVQAFRATGDKKYLDRAALTMAAYLNKLQQTNGLFFHAPDSQFFWGRGNGWFAAGMAELLRDLPADHPKRERIMSGYKTMMASLLKYQGEDGLWRQLIDHPEAWAETSGSAMFSFAMVTGVKQGWLDAKTYGPAARKAWLALVGDLDADANVKEVCIGTGKAYESVGADRETQLKYYLARPRRTGDLHGQSPILWTASALLR
jgi:unsaturated rhamnogalacturonyl hydrolase